MKEGYKLFSEAFVLFLVFFSLALTACAEDGKVFLVDLEYRQGDLVVGGWSVADGFAPSRVTQPSDGYICRVYSLNKGVLEEFRFLPSEEVCFDSVDSSGEYSFECMKKDTNLVLAIDYYVDAEEIAFYNAAGGLKGRIEVHNPGMTAKDEEVSKENTDDGNVNQYVPCLVAAFLGLAFLALIGNRFRDKKIREKRDELLEWNEEQEKLR
jgi:hypothetical protein